MINAVKFQSNCQPAFGRSFVKISKPNTDGEKMVSTDSIKGIESGAGNTILFYGKNNETLGSVTPKNQIPLEDVAKNLLTDEKNGNVSNFTTFA